MNKEYKIKLDLNKKLYNKKMAFNQFDENVNDFYIEVTKNNEVVKDLDKSIITLVAIKPNGEVDAQFIEVKEGQIYADLKPSMCDLVGNYQAKAMIVLEGEIVTTDTINYSVSEDKIISRLNEDVVSDERFPLFTDALARLSDIEISEEQRIINEAERILSEENRKIEEAKRVEAELIRQHEEADRSKYDATRESNENIRKQNESTRLANETNRIDEEAKRVDEENKRKLAEEERKANYDFMTEDEERRRSEANAHKEAEVLRVQAETNRVNEEAKRRTTEQARVSAENTRVSNENTREANEEARKSNETKRVEAETQRQNRYNSFIADAEANASNFENYTNSAKASEEERKANEVVREENEISRQGIFEDKVDEFNEKIVELNTTKENFVSSINTKVDNKISEIDKSKTDMTTTVSNKIDEVETRFNALTSKQQQGAEVIDARDGETSLKARLDRDIEKAKQVYVNIEGSNISTDSSVGYAKDVEILGNTIQDASNLADIRSVGDKVEGQELYEIPVVSRGKNLFDSSKYRDIISNYDYTVSGGYKCKYIKLKPNTTYIVSASASNNVGALFINIDAEIFRSGYLDLRLTTSVSKTYRTDDKGLLYIGTSSSDDTLVKLLLDRDIQIEENTKATPYEPYIEDKLTILSPVQLEKVGDVADRIICKDGVWGVEKNVTAEVQDNVLVNTRTKSEFIPLPHSQQVKLRTFANKTNISFLTEIEGMIKAQVPKSLGATVNTHTEQISNLNKELDRVKKLEENTVSTVVTESDFTTVEATSNGYFEDVKLEGKTLVVNSDNEVVESGIDGAMLKSVGEDVDEIVVSTTSKYNYFDYSLISRGRYLDSSSISTLKYNSSICVEKGEVIDVNIDKSLTIAFYSFSDENGYTQISEFKSGCFTFSIPTDVSSIGYEIKKTGGGSIVVNYIKDKKISIISMQDKKRLLYYNEETQTWEKPILRQWDSIEKHADGKYYYHVRSVEEDYTEGDETVSDYITDMTTTVKPLAQEKVYECTNIDLITYANETNYIVECGAIVPRTTLKVHNNISNVVNLLQKKVSLLESNIKASQEVQDMMILETDMRMLDIELALMEFIPMKLNLGGSNMLRSATYFNFLKNHIINETYEKEYLENVMNKYLATGRINQDEYDELYKMLYPPVYDIELPIEY